MILLYRSSIVEPDTIIVTLRLDGSIDLDQFGPPAGWPTDVPPAGYLVARETWKGLDILPGPVTRAQIEALPDPGPDPGVTAAHRQAEVQGILDMLRTTPIDPAALDANLALAAAGLAIPDLPASDVEGLTAFLALSSPTATQTAAAAKALIRVLADYADVISAQRATIAVLADTIRFILQRGT